MTPGLNDLQLYGTLAFYGMVGCLIREGLNSLTGFEYGGIIWANICGCVVMGLHKSILPEKMHLHVGTGLCGSITSFSTLILQLFEVSTHRQPSWNNGGYGVMVFLAFLIIQISCSFTALRFGHHLGTALNTYKLQIAEENLIYHVYPVLAVLGWIAALVCAICIENGRFWTLMCVFGPIGVWTRYYFARYNEKIFKKGTFLCNIAGTILIAVLGLLENKRFGFSKLQYSILQGLASGICGNLTTISTFINELDSMPLKPAYVYFTVTVGLAFICTLLIMGPYMWLHDAPYL